MDKINAELVKLLASIITAMCMLIIVPIAIWTLTTVIGYGGRIVSLEEWRGEGRRYTDIDAGKDFGVVIVEVRQNKAGVTENQLAIKELSNAVTELRLEHLRNKK